MTATIPRPAPPTPPVPAPAGTRLRRPSTDPWHWAVTGACLLAVLAAATSLNGVVEPWVWLMPVLRTLVPVLLAMALTRALGLKAVLTALVGVLALVGALTAQFLPLQGILGVVPGPGTALELQRLLAQAEETVVSQVAPVLPGGGILLVMCAALGLIAVVVDLFATTLRMPAVTGLGLLGVMIAPAIVKPNGVGMFAFMASALAYLLLLALGRWRENHLASGGARASSGFAARSAVIGAGALAVAVILPLFVPGFTSGAFPQGSRLNVWGNATGLNPAVTLGNDLRNPTGFGRITYSTTSGTPLYLRAVTLENFDGRRWEPDQRLDDRVDDVDELGTETGVPDSRPAGQDILTRITTQSYASPWLLSPYAPEGVSDLEGSWAWDPNNLSILATDGGSTARQEYVVESRSAELTREGLGSIGPSTADDVPDVFRELPDDTPEIVRTTTQEVSGGFVNPYDKALAIQSYLRGTDFTYSEEAPVEGGYDGSGMDVMARFLETRSGYCVHYAGTMAVMAREAGIPSRIAVGYTPGTPTGDTEEGPGGVELREFTVDSRNAHAWPELYFEGVGWVQFEPTPSRGVVPSYAQSASVPVGPRADEGDALNPGAAPETGVPTGAAAAPSEQAEGGGTTGPQEEAQPLRGLLAVGGLALVALLPMLLRLARTRARRSAVVAVSVPGTTSDTPRGSGAATAAWAETTEMAGDYGFPLEATDTPRTFAGRLARNARLGTEPAGSLSRLRSAFEYEEYADHAPSERSSGAVSGSVVSGSDVSASAASRRAFPGGDDGSPARSIALAPATLPSVGPPRWEDVDAVTRALRNRSSIITRLKARLLPRSLLNRFTGGTGR